MTKRRSLSAAFKKKVALAALRGDKTLQELAAKIGELTMVNSFFWPSFIKAGSRNEPFSSKVIG